VRRPGLPRRLAAEALGTFCLAVILAVATDTRAAGSLAALAGAAVYAFLRGGEAAVPLEQEAAA
jgi:hypothetical protein